MQRAFEAAGLRLYNEAVLVTNLASLILRVGKQFDHSRKLGKSHQNVLTFVKGDPRRATLACGPIQTVDQVAAHAQTEAVGIIQTGPDGEVRTVGLPISFDGARTGFERDAPRLGQHNGEILRR